MLPLNVIKTMTDAVLLSNSFGLAAIPLITELLPEIESTYIGRINTIRAPT